MAIAPGTQELLTLTENISEKGIELNDYDAVSAYMLENNYTKEDFNAYSQQIKELLEGTRDPETFQKPSASEVELQRVLEEKPFGEQNFFERLVTGQQAQAAMMGRGTELAAAAVVKGVGDVASVVQRPIAAVGEAVAPKTTEKIGNVLDDAVNFVDSKVQSTDTGRKFSYALKELADPVLSPEEKAMVDITSMLVPFAAATKVTKALGMKPGAKKRFTDFVLFDYAIKNENDHQMADILTEYIPSTKPLLERLVINENDTEAEKELKKIIDSGLTAGLFEGLFGVVGGAFKQVKNIRDKGQRLKEITEIVDSAKAGAKERIKRAEAIALDAVDEPIVMGAKTAKEVADGAPVPVKTEVAELGDQYVQKGTIARVLEPVVNNIPYLDRVNTALARGLKTTGQLPAKLVPAFRTRANKYQADLKQIKVDTKILRQDLNKAKKEAKRSGQSSDDVVENTRLALTGGRDDVQKIEFKINDLAKEAQAAQAKKIIQESNKNKNKGKTTKQQRSELDKRASAAVEQSAAELRNNVNLAMRGDASALLKLPPEIQKVITQSQSIMGAGEAALSKLPKYLQDTVRATKRNINKKDSAVKQIYGVGNKDDFVLGLADDGTTYFTRQYEIYTNPRWAKALRSGIAARSAAKAGTPLARKTKKIADKNTPEINEIIDRAFKNLKDKNPGVDEQVLWKTLDDFATVGGRDEEAGLIFEALAGGRHLKGDTAVKVMSKKNLAINEPILAFLGEIKDPLRMVDSTLRNQSKAITLGRFAKEVESFILTNEGKAVSLGGFFESLPKTSTRFLSPPKQIAAAAEKTPVGAYIEGAAGSIGTNTSRIMPRVADFTTSKQMAQVLERGTEMFGYTGQLGGLWGRVVAGAQRAAAYGQSTQTTLDLQQHINNMYGMFQALASGGFLTNPKQFVKFAQQSKIEVTRAATQERKLRSAVNKSGANQDVVDLALLGNPEAYASLPKNVRKAIDGAKELSNDMRLREAGVLDSSVVATPIKNVTLDRWGDPKTMDGWLGTLGKVVKYPLRLAQDAYGFTDDFGKKIAHKIEMEELAYVYPDKPLDEIFNMASNNVLEKLPSYTYAAPLVREFGKYPIGAYPVYTAERLRNNFNILKMALRDLKEANATGNSRLRAKAGKSVAALAGVYAGKEAYRMSQEIENDWTEGNKRGLRVLLPEWQQASIQIPTEPFYVDKDGHVKTKFVDGSTFDADSYLRQPVARLYALSQDYEEGEITETELNNLRDGILTDLTAQYYALKGLYGAGKTALSGVDEFNRSVRRGISLEDDALNTLASLGKVIEPGTSQNIRKYMEAVATEEALGEGKGKTKSGFPLRAKEIRNFLIYGIRNNTFDVDAALNQKVKENFRNKVAAADSFYQIIKDIPVRKRSEQEKRELYKNIEDNFIKYQDIVVQNNRELYDIGQAVSGIEFNYTNKKTGEEGKQFFDVVSSMATMNAEDSLNDTIFNSAIDIMENINAPLDFNESQGIAELIKFDANTVDSEILNIMADVSARYIGKQLYETK